MTKKFKVWSSDSSKFATIHADNEAEAIKEACKAEWGLGIVDGDVLTVQAESPQLQYRVELKVTGVSLVRDDTIKRPLTTDKIPPHERPTQ